VSDSKRRKIITTARQMFTTMPYDKVATAEIAKQAGVAYGLIAHHFEHKRGLYLAVIGEMADEIAELHDTATPSDAPPTEQLRDVLRHHVAYIDAHADTFLALMRGGVGADLEHQTTIETLRSVGIRRIQGALGITDPVPPVLRTALRGWVGYLDEIMIDRIVHGDVAAESLVDLAYAALIVTLRRVRYLDGTIQYGDDVVAALNSEEAR